MWPTVTWNSPQNPLMPAQPPTLHAPLESLMQLHISLAARRHPLESRLAVPAFAG
jgi:hypothetical protein